MPLTTTVEYHAHASHRIPIFTGPAAKCGNVHGHTFGLRWVFATDTADPEQAEFGAINRVLRGWVDTFFDHGYVCGPDDEIGVYLTKLGMKVWWLPDWPTTENITTCLAHNTIELLPDLELLELTVQEGNSNAVTWRPEVCERRA